MLLLPADPWPDTVALAQRLERLGFHHLWTYDHLSWQRYRDRPWHGTHPWLAGIAGVTSRIRLGTMVSNLNLRHPLLLARDALTIDHQSEGRFTLGVGAGGIGFDAHILGQVELTPLQRAQRLQEAVYLLDALLRGNIEDYEGAYYTISGARMALGCVQEPRIPLAIAAAGPRALRLAAEYGDAWITYGKPRDTDASPAQVFDVISGQVERLAEHCSRLERDPMAISRIHLIGNTSEQPLESMGRFDDFVGRYAEIGFTDFVFHMPRPGDPTWQAAPNIVEEIANAYLK